MSRDHIVTEVFPGGPAEVAMIRPGDRMVAVGDVPIEGFTSAQMSELVRGPVGTIVAVDLVRRGQSEPVALSLTRAPIQVDWVSTRVLDDRIGILRLRSFAAPEGLGLF